MKVSDGSQGLARHPFRRSSLPRTDQYSNDFEVSRQQVLKRRDECQRAVQHQMMVRARQHDPFPSIRQHLKDSLRSPSQLAINIVDCGSDSSQHCRTLTRLYNTPPPTQGLVSLLILGQLDHLFDGERMDSLNAPFVHACVEATKQAFAGRDQYVTDPAHMTVAAQGLLAPARNCRATS